MITFKDLQSNERLEINKNVSLVGQSVSVIEDEYFRNKTSLTNFEHIIAACTQKCIDVVKIIQFLNFEKWSVYPDIEYLINIPSGWWAIKFYIGGYKCNALRYSSKKKNKKIANLKVEVMTFFTLFSQASKFYFKKFLKVIDTQSAKKSLKMWNEL